MRRRRRSRSTNAPLSSLISPVTSPLLLAAAILIHVTILSTTKRMVHVADALNYGVGSGKSYDHCDDGSVGGNVRLSKLTPNTFHKVCPGRVSTGTSSSSSSSSSSGADARLGQQPQCGDGTAFSFFVSRPPQRYDNAHKILIEFQGGGACWDGTTCSMQADYLTYPEAMDNFLGLSCSEINYGLSNGNNNNRRERRDRDRQLGSNSGDGANGMPISVLCGQTVGGVNFAEYNTIVVPYCTQDIHIGNNFASYSGDNNGGDGNGGDGGNTVAHKGGHNLFSVLQYVFANFPNPSNIALTGCSAGGTVLPVAYDILNKHYNTPLLTPGPLRSTQINVMSDSPVYLTPQYFLQNAFDSWQPWSVMKRLRFNYNKYRYDTNYPTALWDHVLRRGKNGDRWGFVSHTDDPVSLTYYQWMSGYDGNDDDRRRRLEDANGNNGNADADEWWSELTSSLSTIQSKHGNVDTFFIDSEGHCSFGLYYALQEDGFDDFAATVFRERSVVVGRVAGSVPSFLASLFLGVGLAAASIAAGRRQRRKITDLDDSKFLPPSSPPNGGGEAGGGALLAARTAATKLKRRFSSVFDTRIGPFLADTFGRWPVTSGYGLAASVYLLLALIIGGGFVHPLNNPSLGPSAYTLSVFGILNPSMVVYDHQVWRLFASPLLCSGVLTYLIVLTCLWKYVRYVELAVNNVPLFVAAALFVAGGGNLVFLAAGAGASCSSVGLVLGLNAFSIACEKIAAKHSASLEMVAAGEGGGGMEKDMGRAAGGDDATATAHAEGFPTPWWGTAFALVVAATLFPFNSWLLLVGSVLTGFFLAPMLCRWDGGLGSRQVPTIRIQAMALYGLSGAFVVVFIILLAVRRPGVMYRNPNLTGCRLVYTTKVSDFVDGYYSNNGRRRRELIQDTLPEWDLLRRLEEDGGGSGSGDGGDQMCAQLCLPNIAYRPLLWGIQSYTDFAVQPGLCEDNGYQEHVADKTFSHMTVTVDVEVFYMSDNDDDR